MPAINPDELAAFSGQSHTDKAAARRARSVASAGTARQDEGTKHFSLGAIEASLFDMIEARRADEGIPRRAFVLRALAECYDMPIPEDYLVDRRSTR